MGSEKGRASVSDMLFDDNDFQPEKMSSPNLRNVNFSNIDSTEG